MFGEQPEHRMACLPVPSQMSHFTSTVPDFSIEWGVMCRCVPTQQSQESRSLLSFGIDRASGSTKPTRRPKVDCLSSADVAEQV